MKDKPKIALTFSGGGYRAATFHLGALSYFHTIKLGDSTLLDYVVALSTISGGTITSLRYMLGLNRGESVNDIFKHLYNFFTKTDLATVAMDNLSVYREGQCASLIRTMDETYNKELFNNAVLGDLMDKIDEIYIHHFSANATDFTNGLAFRFQATENTGIKPNNTSGYRVVGNHKIRIPRSVAGYIRLSEILACSSCFPSGFEQMAFPRDFVLSDLEEVKNYIAGMEPFGIMDGGSVDNHGIEPIFLAEERMARYVGNPEEHYLDLVIISDVASPYINAYSPFQYCLPESIGNLTLKKLSGRFWIAELVATGIIATSYIFTSFFFLSGFLTALWALLIGVFIAYIVLKKKLLKIAMTTVIRDSMPSVLNLRFKDIATLFANRVSSVLLLVSSVFMKLLRRMGYLIVYQDNTWHNRSVMNGIYELRLGESWISRLKYGQILEFMKPGQAIQQNSEKAASMGTTLCFTKEEKDSGMPDALIAAGQYTVCWNLLVYIEEIKKDPTNTNKHHQQIIVCEEQLRKDWEAFQKIPLWIA